MWLIYPTTMKPTMSMREGSSTRTPAWILSCCTEPPFDTLTLRLSSLNRHSSYKVGLLSTISYFYQNIAMKVIVSDAPLPEDEELISTLRLTAEDLKNINRTNFFYAQ